jgi:hypothetical protein
LCCEPCSNLFSFWSPAVKGHHLLPYLIALSCKFMKFIMA